MYYKLLGKGTAFFSYLQIIQQKFVNICIFHKKVVSLRRFWASARSWRVYRMIVKVTTLGYK